MKKASNEFLREALAQMPRLLGQLNRNPSSLSYGSFDRAFWHYRTNDISCARYQEAVYTLTLLFCSQFEGNEYYRDEKILEWIRAALCFTANLQRSNGSFDEWYVNEGSYVATAFLTSAIGQTILLLKSNDINFAEEILTRNVLKKAADFLLEIKENTVMNQVSGAIFALALAGKDTGHLLEEFLEKQNEEGWWSEYGGPDIGYLSLTISYLEKYRKLTHSTKADAAISKAKKFVETFINPDHTAGGEYMSRNTEYIIPSTSLAYLGAVRPAHLDDRYLCYILYNWIETGIEIAPQPIKVSLGESFFNESSILRVVNKKYYLVSNAKKGGSFRLYSGGKVYFDSGLEINFGGEKFSTGILDSANEISFQTGILKTSGSAKKIKEPLLKTHTAIVFKLWQFIFGRIPYLYKFVKDLLRHKMISYSGVSAVPFKRVIEYSPHKVIVTDTVFGVDLKDDIISGVKASYSAVPSSKYAPIPELARNRLSPVLEEKLEGNAYIIKRTFSFND